MKKYIKIIIVIVIIIFGIVFLKKPITRWINSLTRKTDILNFLNGKSYKNIDKKQVTIWKNLGKEIEYFEIDEIIDDFIKTTYKAIGAVAKGKTIEEFESIAQKSEEFVDKQLYGLTLLDEYNACGIFINLEKDSSVKERYKNDTFLNDIVEEIEESVEHTEEKKDKGWRVKNNGQNTTIDLPYGSSLIIYPPKYTPTNEVEEVIDVELGKRENEQMYIKIIYLDNNDNQKEYSTNVLFNDDDMYIGVDELYFTKTKGDIFITNKDRTEER